MIDEHELVKKSTRETAELMTTYGNKIHTALKGNRNLVQDVFQEEPLRYRWGVEMQLTQLSQLLRRIERSSEYINKFDLKVELSSLKDLSLSEHINYHFGYYRIGIVSVYDVALQIVNAVIRLGIPNKEVNRRAVMNNLLIKDLKLDAFLKDIDKVVAVYRGERNRQIHQGVGNSISAYFQNTAVSSLSIIESISPIAPQLFDFDKVNIEELRLEAIELAQTRMLLECESLAISLVQLLDILYDQYLSRLVPITLNSKVNYNS
ncbi:MAG: hypothetical protein HOC69_04315 [Candidatus Marinimicrobia bacterium]|nr:hypothetical protein [Candidatus Neomarinimicrobiota bacterium]